MIPLWAISAIGAAALAGFAGWQYGTSVEGAKLERARTAWAEERTRAAERSEQALRAEIEAHNATRTELEANHAQAENRRAAAAAQAASAAAAADAAQRSAGRLRDAIETHRLGTAAALAASGAAGQCQASTEAAAVLRGLLVRFDAAAGRLADHARASSADADRQHAAASECAGYVEAVSRGGAAP